MISQKNNPFCHLYTIELLQTGLELAGLLAKNWFGIGRSTGKVVLKGNGARSVNSFLVLSILEIFFLLCFLSSV